MGSRPVFWWYTVSARKPSEHCRGVLKQGTKIALDWTEVNATFTHMQLRSALAPSPRTTKGIKWPRKRSVNVWLLHLLAEKLLFHFNWTKPLATVRQGFCNMGCRRQQLAQNNPEQKLSQQVSGNVTTVPCPPWTCENSQIQQMWGKQNPVQHYQSHPTVSRGWCTGTDNKTSTVEVCTYIQLVQTPSEWVMRYAHCDRWSDEGETISPQENGNP